MCVPLGEIEWLGLGDGGGVFAARLRDTVGEEAAADGGAVLCGPAVAVEDLEFKGWGLRWHFKICCCPFLANSFRLIMW